MVKLTSCKIVLNPNSGFYKRDDFDFDIVNFPFLDGDVPRRTSYGVYISTYKIRRSFFKS